MAPRGNDRLEREDHAAVVERADDFVGDGHGAAPLRLPALARLVEAEAVAAAFAREIERRKRPAYGRLGADGMVGKDRRADRDGRRHRANVGIDDAVANRRHETAGDRLHPLPAAILEHDPELVRRESADAILAAQGAADAPPDDGDHLVADVVAIGLVDEGEVVDAGKQKRALGGGPAGASEKAGELFGQSRPVELPGEFVVAAEIEEPFLPFAAVVDHPERALRHAWTRLRVDRADAGVLDPQRRPAAAPLGEEAITEAITQLCLGRDMGTAGDPVIAGAGLLRVDEKSKGAASGDLLDIGDTEHGVGIGRPLDPVAGEVPAIGRLAHACEDLLEVEWRFAWACRVSAL